MTSSSAKAKVLKPGQAAPTDSATLQELKAIERIAHPFEVSAILGVPGPHTVYVRAASKREQDRAVASSHAYVDGLAKHAASVKDDPDVVTDAKQAAIVAETFRITGEPTSRPVWDTADQVVDSLTPRQIAALANISSAVRFRYPPAVPELSDEAVEAFATTAATYVATDMPDVLLATLPREHLTQLAIMLAHKLVRERAERSGETVPESEVEHEFIPEGGEE